jgi:DNA processing protein
MSENFALFLNYLFCDSPYRIKKIISQYNNLDTFSAHLDTYLANQNMGTKKSQEIKKRFAAFNLEEYKTKLTKLGLKYILADSPKYPAQLRQISHHPIVLFYKGNIDLLSQEIISIVGSRIHSRYGAEATRKLVQNLKPYFIIASGGAKGIDTIAHTTALEHDIPTISVWGTGLDIPYPYENKALFTQIEKKGLLISEYPPGIEPLSYRFPQRNRIISGIAKGVLVCEAGEKSGSLITAYYALEQNREVFVVPGSIFSPYSKGTNKLIQQGGKLISNVSELVSEFQYLFKIPKNNKPKTQHPPEEYAKIQNLPKEERQIYELLSLEPINIDTIIPKLTIPIHKILASLTILELKGLIEQIPGKNFKTT